MNIKREKGCIFENSKEKLVPETCYYKFAISHEEIALHLTFSFTSFEMELKPLMIRQATVNPS